MVGDEVPLKVAVSLLPSVKLIASVLSAKVTDANAS
jgi:hypothetical protein